MPSSVSAARTSSSLNGLITAVMSFMTRAPVLPHPRRSPLASRALRHPPYCTRRKLQHETLGLRADFCLFSQPRMPAAAASSRIMAAPFLGDHDRRRIGVGGRHRRHDGGVDDAQPCEPAHPQPGVDDRHRVLAHLAGADDVIDGRALLADVVGERLFAGDTGAGRGLPDAVPGHAPAPRRCGVSDAMPASATRRSLGADR